MPSPPSWPPPSRWCASWKRRWAWMSPGTPIWSPVTAWANIPRSALPDTARLLKTRGLAMQSAVPVGEGGMTALIGAEIEQAEEVAKEAAAAGGTCVVANDNAPGQVVISGTLDALARVPDIAKTKGIKRALPLAVSAPFHCPLMQPAADRMAEALAAVTVRPLAVPVIANVTAGPVSEPDSVRRLLVQQVTGRVRWRES